MRQLPSLATYLELHTPGFPYDVKLLLGRFQRWQREGLRLAGGPLDAISRAARRPASRRQDARLEGGHIHRVLAHLGRCLAGKGRLELE